MPAKKKRDTATNERYAEAQARAETLVAEWQARLGFAALGIRIYHTFVEDFHENDQYVVADTQGFWQYRHARIRWFLPGLTRLSDERVEETIVHELIHVLLSPMESHVTNRFEEQCEYAVETMTQAMLHLKASTDGP